MVKLALIILVLVFALGCNKDMLEGPFQVVKVIDGDTIELNNSKRVRFSGINTPETGECYYTKAKDKLAEMILNKDVFLERDRTNIDKYGRLLRYVYIENLMTNKVLVEGGYARVFDKYKEDTKRYEELKQKEIIAKEQKLGVWGCKDKKEDCLYVRSKNSKNYHSSDCKWAKKIKPINIICLNKDSELSELNPCKTCLK